MSIIHQPLYTKLIMPQGIKKPPPPHPPTPPPISLCKYNHKQPQTKLLW